MQSVLKERQLAAELGGIKIVGATFTLLLSIIILSTAAFLDLSESRVQ